MPDTTTHISVQPWSRGLEPVERPGHTGHDNGMVTLIVVLMLCICLSFKNIQRLWATIVKRLWNTRSRRDYDIITSTEKRTLGLMLCVAVIFISLIVNAAFSYMSPQSHSFTLMTTLCLTALFAVYFLFQYIVYEMIGYSFSSDEGRILWVEGFTAAMTLLGVGLMIPGLMILFYPEVTKTAIIIAGALYVCARIMFICKGFRIFYTNLGSIVYFILYLCALEFVPIALLFYLSGLLCAN